MGNITINKHVLGRGYPAYFIADIAANHDGDLERAKKLIVLAKQSGADAAKFQNFQADTIVSQQGFEMLGAQLSHQAKWKKSVFQVYQEASIPYAWTEELKSFCDEVGIDYFSSPYDFAAVDMLEPYVGAYKIGSGEITWLEMLEYVAQKGKPVLLATGASSATDVERAVAAVLRLNEQLILMQCNTNYTGSQNNFQYVHLNVLKTYHSMYPNVLLGLSDHTPGHAAVLGAVALGARVIEKHFTDDTARTGPDHGFSMTPQTWREMVQRTRELEAALGSGVKKVEENERDTIVVQRRCLRAADDLPSGLVLTRDHVVALRPAPADGLSPHDLRSIVGKRLRVTVGKGKTISTGMLAESDEQ